MIKCNLFLYLLLIVGFNQLIGMDKEPLVMQMIRKCALSSEEEDELKKYWQERLHTAVGYANAQEVRHCIKQGANPHIKTSCGEKTYMVAFLDTCICGYFSSSFRSNSSLSQEKFNQYISKELLAVLYVLVKADVRYEECNYSCIDRRLKEYRNRVWACVETFEKQVDQLQEDCLHSKVEAIESAVKNHIPLCIPNAMGNTLLHDAFAQNRSSVIRKLVEADGKLLLCKNNDGKLPTDMAVRR